MEHDVDIGLDDRGDEIRVGDRADQRVHSTIIDRTARQIRCHDGRKLHTGGLREQSVDQPAAEKPGSSGHEDLHAMTACVFLRPMLPSSA